jgi:hypothetical protein
MRGFTEPTTREDYSLIMRSKIGNIVQMDSITISNILTILPTSRRLRLQVDGYGYEVEK